jgi:hypothetical protein
MSKPSGIFKSVTCFNQILQLYGLGFSLDGVTGKIKDNLCNRIGFLVSLSWAILLCIVIAVSEPVFDSKKVRFEIVLAGWHYQYQLEVVLVLPLMIFNYIKRKHVELFLAKVHEFDETLAQMNWISTKNRRPRACYLLEWDSSCRRFYCPLSPSQRVHFVLAYKFQ